MKTDRKLSLPFGIFVGIIWALINQILKINAGKYQLVMKNEEDPFNNEI